ncbi:hypothetical protein N5D48_17160 [Pseudomonas sp. GD03858]|uniref:hypothetical protein n=1 Tax=unclassified Pseudomonas TaxID=196821 RepID=UPI00244A7C62|nr:MULTISPECIES: hypothetical protein [unclassified Pseudomonas]MDH0648631.1 hypothetical protein [Pseudomonas sp. GD03867]MDH0664138.1 hypothetical protein [Pseudomonas sp. GD03858]
MRFYLLLVAVLATAGCGTTKTNVSNLAEAQKYDPASTARIRLITGGGESFGYVGGQSCETYYNVSRKSGIVPPPGWRVVRSHTSEEMIPFSSHYPSDYYNNVIGMPASAKTQRIDATHGYFDERVVPAGQNFIADLSLGTRGSSCSPAPASFTPQAGKDYEVRLDYTAHSYFGPVTCRVGVYELQSAGSVASVTKDVPVAANYCVSDATGTYRTLEARSVAQPR